MAKRAQYTYKPYWPGLKFRQASFDLLTDFLVNLNKENKDKLNSLSKCSGCFKDKKLTEYILQMTAELSLEPQVGYHAVELIQRFMTTHLTNLFTAHIPQEAVAVQGTSYEDAVLDQLKHKFSLIVFTCVQLASKLSLYTNMISNNTAVCFLQSIGLNVSKKTLLDTELMILKGLEFKLSVSNPLTYVDILLEVLGHNEPSVPVEHTYGLCQQVLQFVVLERTAIYDSLLMVTTRCRQPSLEQREKFLTVTEDCMLLAVAVIAVALYIFHISQWDKVVSELSNITGISRRSIIDFAHVILLHIVGSSHL